MSDWKNRLQGEVDADPGGPHQPYVGPVLKADLSAVLSEVRRLREENARLACAANGLRQCCEEQCAALVQEREWRTAEARGASTREEGLRAEVARLKRMWPADAEIRAAKAEAKLAEAEAEHPTGMCLERGLKSERDRLRRDLDRKDHEVAELKAEVARLTAALAGTVAQVEEQRKRAERAEAEVARLHKYQGLAGQRADKAEAEVARLEGLGSVKSALRLQDERQELVNTKLALQSEVERLREALEAACAGVCRLCEEATYPARPGKLRPGEWWHDVGSAQLVCKAAAFRAALAPEVKRHDWSCASDCECNFKAAKRLLWPAGSTAAPTKEGEPSD